MCIFNSTLTVETTLLKINQLTYFSGKTLDFYGKTFNSSGKAIRLSGKTINSSGKTIAFFGKAIGLSGKTNHFIGKAINSCGKASHFSGKASHFDLPASHFDSEANHPSGKKYYPVAMNSTFIKEQILKSSDALRVCRAKARSGSFALELFFGTFFWGNAKRKYVHKT